MFSQYAKIKHRGNDKHQADLAAYEKRVQDNIAANKAKLVELGIEAQRKAICVQPKPARPFIKKKRKAAVEPRVLPSRATRSTGSLAETPEEINGRANKLSKMSKMSKISKPKTIFPSDRRPRYHDWKFAEYNENVPLTDEERSNLRVPSDWLDDFAAHWLDEGDSEANRRSVMKVLLALVSGDGLTSSQRGGVFAEGQKVDLHTDLEALALEAHYFLPMKSMPFWMKGLYPEPAPGGARDKSNGWWANHPIMKLQKYQRLLRDQSIEDQRSGRVCKELPSSPSPLAPATTDGKRKAGSSDSESSAKSSKKYKDNTQLPPQIDERLQIRYTGKHGGWFWGRVLTVEHIQKSTDPNHVRCLMHMESVGKWKAQNDGPFDMRATPWRRVAEDSKKK